MKNTPQWTRYDIAMFCLLLVVLGICIFLTIKMSDHHSSTTTNITQESTPLKATPLKAAIVQSTAAPLHVKAAPTISNAKRFIPIRVKRFRQKKSRKYSKKYQLTPVHQKKTYKFVRMKVPRKVHLISERIELHHVNAHSLTSKSDTVG